MALGERLRKVREDKGLKQNYVAKLLGITNQALSNWERGERDPDTPTLHRLAEIYGVSADYLLGITNDPKGKASTMDILDILERNKLKLIAAGRPLTPQQRLNLIRALDQDKPPAGPSKQVPIVATIRAGIPILTEEHVSGYLDIPADIRAHFAVQIRGDSMIWAGLHEGDYALCREAESAHTGQMVVAAVQDPGAGDWGGTVKYFVQANGKKILRAANPDYEDITMGPEDRVVGTVVAVLKKDPPALYLYENLAGEIAGLAGEWSSLAKTAANYGLRPREIERLVELFAHVVKQVRK